MTEPWIGLGLVVAMFAVLLAIFSMIGPLLQPEVLRKGLHMSMGLTTLTFPWLFDSPWPVVIVAGASTVAFLIFRTRFLLFRRLARAMHGGDRDRLRRSQRARRRCPRGVANRSQGAAALSPPCIRRFARDRDARRWPVQALSQPHPVGQRWRGCGDRDGRGDRDRVVVASTAGRRCRSESVLMALWR